MKNRQELAKYFAELGFKTGVEVGVYKGAYSRELCQANPELKLYCVDFWKINSTDEKIKRVYGKIFKYAQHKLAPFNTTLIRDYSMNAVKQFADNSLDFVYIDAEHIYPEVEQDVREWAKKVRMGGIIAGHDYDIADVKKVVDEYALRHKYRPNLTDEAIAINWWFAKEQSHT